MIQYKIFPDNLNSHLFSVELSFATQIDQTYHLSLPAWLPGSYMIRDFAKNIIEIYAHNDNQEKQQTIKGIPLNKTDKQTWQFVATGTSTVITYQCFSFQQEQQQQQQQQQQRTTTTNNNQQQ